MSKWKLIYTGSHIGMYPIPNTHITTFVICGDKYLPFYIPNTREINNQDELDKQLNKLANDVDILQGDIKSIKEKIENYNTMINGINSLNLPSSSESSISYKCKVEKKLKIHHIYYKDYFSAKELPVVNNVVEIPERCTPFFYMSKVDLKKYKIGDILKIKFKDNNRNEKQYRGKEVEFVVNNSMIHYDERYNRLVLTINKDNWTNKDVIVLEDICRFDDLIDALWPCNRRPFAGYKNKTVKVEKVGEVKELPLFEYRSDERSPYLFECSSEKDSGNIILEVINEKDRNNGKNKYYWNLVPVGNDKDVKLAIDFIKREIRNEKEYIKKIEKDIEHLNSMLNMKDKYLEILKDQ